MRNPITWILDLFRSKSETRDEKPTDERHLKLDDFFQRHTPGGQIPGGKATVVYDDYALMAMTYPTAGEARDHMHIDFKISITSVTTALAAVASSFGFGQTQQDFAFYWLCQNGAFDNADQLKAVARRIAGNNQSWYEHLLELVGPVPRGNWETDI